LTAQYYELYSSRRQSVRQLQVVTAARGLSLLHRITRAQAQVTT